MTPIQPILLILLVAAAILYFSRLRSLLLDRLVVALLLATGIIMVLAPDLTTRVAHLVGVGRGADLVIYLSLIGFGFLWLILYSEIRALQARLTDLARDIAIEKSRGPDDQSRTLRSD